MTYTPPFRGQLQPHAATMPQHRTATRSSHSTVRGFLHAILGLLLASKIDAQTPSHPPLREDVPLKHRPLEKGPHRFVEPTRGNDDGPGTQEAPWRTLTHAVRQLRPGETLVLRGGVYHENLYVTRVGRPDAPITFRSFPGERAIIDGSWREYFEMPEKAWEPYPGGGPEEFRSTRSHPNVRDVLGSFGDSRIGLQTYYHAIDLRATREVVEWENEKDIKSGDIKPLYVGPGIWYDRDTGRIHARLAATHLPAPMPNYAGPTDPRKLPLLLAPFHGTVLHLDQARHLRFQDLTLRGAGYFAVRLDQAQDITFDRCTIWAGTYGLHVNGTRQLRLLHCGVFGNVAPWTFRADASKRDYPGRPHRNLSRLNTHALLDLDNGRESAVFATPQNDDWEIAHCAFTDAHDGVYLGAINVRFHHNLIDNLQDDGIYLSPMYHRHRLDKRDPEIHIHQNLFRGLLTALAFGGTEAETRDRVFVYRNVFDLRGPVPTGRPAAGKATATISTGHLIGDHGSPPWSALAFYHNTCIQAQPARDLAMASLGSNKAGHPRRVFNNIFFHLARLPAYVAPDPALDVVGDGNLFGTPGVDPKAADTVFRKFRASPMFKASQAKYAPGSSTHDRIGVPGFVAFDERSPSKSDFRLQPRSTGVDVGIDLPEEWPDPLRSRDAGRPDIGALPVGAEPLRVGPER